MSSLAARWKKGFEPGATVVETVNKVSAASVLPSFMASLGSFISFLVCWWSRKSLTPVMMDSGRDGFFFSLLRAGGKVS